MGSKNKIRILRYATGRRDFYSQERPPADLMMNGDIWKCEDAEGNILGEEKRTVNGWEVLSVNHERISELEIDKLMAGGKITDETILEKGVGILQRRWDTNAEKPDNPAKEPSFDISEGLKKMNEKLQGVIDEAGQRGKGEVGPRIQGRDLVGAKPRHVDPGDLTRADLGKYVRYIRMSAEAKHDLRGELTGIELSASGYALSLHDGTKVFGKHDDNAIVTVGFIRK